VTQLGARHNFRMLVLALSYVSSLACSEHEARAQTGQALYLRHCASCHGVSGKGDGPVAASLQIRPADSASGPQELLLASFVGAQLLGESLEHLEADARVAGLDGAADLGQVQPEVGVLLS